MENELKIGQNVRDHAIQALEKKMTQELHTIYGERYWLSIEKCDDGSTELFSSHIEKPVLFSDTQKLAEAVGEWFGYPLGNFSGYIINSAEELVMYLR